VTAMQPSSSDATKNERIDEENYALLNDAVGSCSVLVRQTARYPGRWIGYSWWCISWNVRFQKGISRIDLMKYIKGSIALLL